MNNEDKIKHFYSLEQRRFPIVESLSIEQETNDQRSLGELTVSVTLRSETTNARLMLSFFKVRNLVLNPGNHALAFSNLNISLVNGQWEDANFKVVQGEQDVDVSFFCADFESSFLDENLLQRDRAADSFGDI
jgi:hypothetical protein